jgi:hypothetical protein
MMERCVGARRGRIVVPSLLIVAALLLGARASDAQAVGGSSSGSPSGGGSCSSFSCTSPLRCQWWNCTVPYDGTTSGPIFCGPCVTPTATATATPKPTPTPAIDISTFTITTDNVSLVVNPDWGGAIISLKYRSSPTGGWSDEWVNNGKPTTNDPGRQIQAALWRPPTKSNRYATGTSANVQDWPCPFSDSNHNPGVTWDPYFNPTQAGSPCGPTIDGVSHENSNLGSGITFREESANDWIHTKTIPRNFDPHWNYWINSSVPPPPNTVVEQRVSTTSDPKVIRLDYTATNNEPIAIDGDQNLPVAFLRSEVAKHMYFYSSADNPNVCAETVPIPEHTVTCPSNRRVSCTENIERWAAWVDDNNVGVGLYVQNHDCTSAPYHIDMNRCPVVPGTTGYGLIGYYKELPLAANGGSLSQTAYLIVGSLQDIRHKACAFAAGAGILAAVTPTATPTGPTPTATNTPTPTPTPTPTSTPTATSTPTPTPKGDVLLLVAATNPLGSDDAAISAHLTAQGFTVTPMYACNATAANANGKVLVIMGSSCSPSCIPSVWTANPPTDFSTAAVPVLISRAAVIANMGLTGQTNNAYWGSVANQTQVTMLFPVGGVSGTATVENAPASWFAWGSPNANATIAATVAGDSSKATMFGYAKNALMPGGYAPACRVAGFWDGGAAANFNSNGWALFDVAVNWAVAPSCR